MITEEISTFLDNLYIHRIPQETLNKIYKKWKNLKVYKFVPDPIQIKLGYVIRLVKLDLESIVPAGICVKIVKNTNGSIKHIVLKKKTRLFNIIPSKYYIFQIAPSHSLIKRTELDNLFNN